MKRSAIERRGRDVVLVIVACSLLHAGRTYGQLPVGETVVRFDTNLGSFRVELFDSVAPTTVANFLSYATSGRYQDTFVHRSIPGFVVQGGGYSFSDATGVAPVPTFPPIVNESGVSNVRGTIAMATITGNPNSATSQWFVNLANNPLLDTNNGGFTVFGRVLGSGMNVVDAIAALPRVNAGLPFDTLPVVSPPVNGVHEENLVILSNVQVVPEPASGVLAGVIGFGLAAAARRGVAFRRSG